MEGSQTLHTPAEAPTTGGLRVRNRRSPPLQGQSPPSPITQPQRPASPRDTTPIEVQGVVVSRESIPPIRPEIPPLPALGPVLDRLPREGSPRHTALPEPTPEEEEQELGTIEPPPPVAYVSPPATPRSLTSASISRPATPVSPRVERVSSVRETVPIERVSSVRESTPLTNTVEAPRVFSTREAPPSQQETTLSNSEQGRFATMTGDELNSERTQFRTKYGILRRAYPQFNIPDFPDIQPLHQVESNYNHYVRQIHIDAAVNQYRGGLYIMWLLMELLFTKIGLDASGYAMHQARSMQEYELLLVELGEKNYVEGASSYPVEVRILIMGATNAAVFVLMKFLGRHLGEGGASMVMSLLSNYMGGALSNPNVLPTAQGSAPVAQQPAAPAFDIGSIATMLSSMMGRSTTAPGATPQEPAVRVQRPRYTD